MVKKEVHDSLLRFRVLYNTIIAGALILFSIFDNDLKQAVINLNFGYMISFLFILLVSYYFFYISGKDPGYADATSSQHEPKEIEMETSQAGNNSDLSLEVFENSAHPNRESLLNKSQQKSGNSFYDDNSESDDEERVINLQTAKVTNKTGHSFKNLKKDSHPFVPEQRFCEVCNILQPYRTKHCHLCEKCINKFDHHCVWIGSCVGELNHRKFWVFLLFQTALQVWTYTIVNSGIDHIYVKYPHDMNSDASDSQVESTGIVPYETIEYGLFMVIAFILFLATLFTGVLLVFHTYLILTNQTTWEYTRKDTLSYLRAYPKNFHPFSKGGLENIKMVFFHNNKVKTWELPSPPPSN